MERFKFFTKTKKGELPKASGVYAFFAGKNLLYIGKAANIRDRVKSHFNQPSYRDDFFTQKINKIGYFQTDSEIEALILEANLIKKYQPKYNVIWRDDKNYFYVAFSQNEAKLPYIFITHQPLNSARSKKDIYVGPFVDGTALKKTSRFLRKVFPYYTVKKHPKTKCTYCHLDLCPGPDPDLPDYKKNIKKLILILKGKRNAVLNSLNKEMKRLSKNKNFEEAAKIRDKIYALRQIMAHTRVINGTSNNFSAKLPAPNAHQLLQSIIGLKQKIDKMECYDVSNMQGKEATGSMVVFKDGEPAKKHYKRFKIRLTETPNDIAMLKETILRRLAHPEWKYPEVILIDGGVAQLNAAISAKNQKIKTKNIAVISIAKGKQELWIEGKSKPIPLKFLPQGVYNLIKYMDDEAHRFAIAYHKKLRKKKLLG